MDPLTASYYRSILFHDSQDQRPVPPTLVLMHAWAFKRFQAMGAGSVISKQAALSVAMTWLSTTREGRAFALEHTTIGELFCSDDQPKTTSEVVSEVDWDTVTADSEVAVTIGDNQITGKFLRVRGGGWIDVRVGEESKKFRTSQVQLAGA